MKFDKLRENQSFNQITPFDIKSMDIDEII